MTGASPLSSHPSIAGATAGAPGTVERTPTAHETQGFRVRTQPTDAPTDLAGQVQRMLATIDELGGARSQQRHELHRQIRDLESLPEGDAARAELANTRLLATLQGVQEVSFRVELATKVVDQVAGGVRTITQTQV